MAIEEIKITTVIDDKNSAKTLRDLQQETKKYKDQLVNLDRNSEEYRSTLNRLTQVQGQINTINRDVSASTQNLTDVYSSLTSVVGGVVGGFTAVQSAAVLLGADNDALAETFVRLQASMALIQSLTALSGAIRSARIAMIAFNTAIASNPLVAFTIAIVAVTSAVAALTVGIINNRNSVDELAASYNSLQRNIDLANNELDREIRYMEATGVEQDKLITIRRNALNAQIMDLERALDEMENRRSSANKRERKQLTEQINAISNQLNDFYAKRQKLNDDYTVFEIQQEKKNRDKAAADAKAAATKAAADAKRLSDEMLKNEKLLQDGINETLKIERNRAIERKNQTARELDLNKAIQSEIALNATLQGSLRSLISDPEASIEARINATKELQEAITTGYQLQDELEELRLDNIRKQAEEEINIQELALKKRQQIEKNKQKAQQETYNITSSILSSTSKLLGEETAAGKATAIASTTISTYQAAMSAYSSLAGIPIVGPALGIAAAAAAITAGIANVKNIVATKIPGESGSSVGSSISLPSMPEVTTPIQETHNNMSSYDEDFINRGQRVYVTETDITDTQLRVNIAESNATF